MREEALWYGVVAASSRPVEQQRWPYLPAVLRQLTGVTKNGCCRECFAGHRYPTSLVCTGVVFLRLHGKQWEYVLGPGLLARKQMNACLFANQNSALANSKSLSRCSFTCWQHAEKFHKWLVSVWFSGSGAF